MRNNQPVTQHEFKFPSHYRLISATDRRGVITHCNAQFVEVSGFDHDELVGKNHNLVRHPDMPPAVFKTMWQTLEAGRIWMGLVKNRRKDGDHYWVSAYVTPVLEGSEVVGYESVRVPATSEEIQRAEACYQRLRQGGNAASVGARLRWTLTAQLPFLIGGGLATLAVGTVSGLLPAIITAAGTLVTAGLSNWQQRAQWQSLIAISPASFSNEIVAQTYFDDPAHLARAKLVLACELSRTRTALTRIKDAAGGLDEVADTTHRQATVTSSSVSKQSEATQQIASAITQMSQAIQEVSERVDVNANSARAASQNVSDGNTKADDALQAIRQLKDAVSSISETVQELAQSTSDIGEAASIISTIAEQTNLLALNAAIEAARAGEQGRGFAVVADEVRSLASKTRESTDKIHHIIQILAERSERAVKVSDEGMQAAIRGTEIVEHTRYTLSEINQAVSLIADQTLEMSSAVEEQSSVAEHINQQIVGIADSAQDTQRASDASLVASQTLRDTLTEVNAVIARFK